MKKAREIHDGSPVAKTNQMFLKLHSIGMLDAHGKAVLSLSNWDRWIAKPDRPLGLVIELAHQIITTARYSSVTAVGADIAKLKAYISGITARAVPNKRSSRGKRTTSKKGGKA